MTELWKAPVLDWRDFNHEQVEIIVIDTKEVFQVFLKTKDNVLLCVESGPPKKKII